MRAKGSNKKFSNVDKLVLVGLIGALVYVAQKMTYKEALALIRSYSVTDPSDYTKDFVISWGKAVRSGAPLFEFQGNIYTAYSASRI